VDLASVQQAGIDYIADRRRVILGDDRGLGKTRQALLALDKTGAYPAVVVAPAGHVKTNWAREAALWTPHRTVWVSPGGRPTMLRHDITVIAYTEAHRWAPVLPHGYAALVLDEAHRIKNATARQSDAVLEIAGRAAPDAVMVALTGTIAPNGRNGEVVRVLRAIRRLDQFGGISGMMAMTKHDLHARLTETCYLRRLKDDSLPPRSWASVSFDGDPKVMRAYRAAERGVAARVGDLAGASAAEISAAAVKVRGDISDLRGLLVEAKLREAVDWVDGFRAETGRKIVTFADRRAAVAALARVFGGLRVQGGQSMAERTAMIDKFQADPDALGISCNIAAASEGITLTAASDVLFLEQPWTPGALDQCLDRVHRIGQEHPVIGWIAQIKGTLDEDMRAVLQEKRRSMDVVQDGAPLGSGDWSAQSAVLLRLAGRHAQEN
jgi:SWI/SNF-related matrix-associated actin-dependent regulator of chromatin subfamily A-like protein 1